MFDPVDHEVNVDEAHTHIAMMSSDASYYYLDSVDLIANMINTITEEKHGLYEVIGDIFIPYIFFDGAAQVGATYLESIMKRLYNAHSPIAVLTYSNEDYPSFIPKSGSIICAPYARVNKDMFKEIIGIFEFLCKHRGIQASTAVQGSLRYMPLTWTVNAYKEGSEMSIESAFDTLGMTIADLEDTIEAVIAATMSTRLVQQALAAKIKRNGTQSKKDALIDSILMSSQEEIKGDKIKALELLPLISKSRSKGMSSFLTMGRCLYKIFGGDSKGLDLWREASITEMHDLCDEYWPTLETTSTYYRIHTLQYWAQEDSPERYREWNSISVRTALEASVLATGGDLDIANVTYRKHPTLFICDGDDPKEAKFYKFNGVYYKECGVFDLQDYIEKTTIPEYSEFLKELGKLVDTGGDGTHKEMIQGKITKCITTIVKLKSDSFQLRIVKVLMRLYNKPGFDAIRDSNQYLTVFEDCIFDAERKCIREGFPEDYCTCSTGYEFKKAYEQYNWEHPEVKIVLDNLNKILYDKDKQELMRREFASFLHASNPSKRGITVYGPTNNGKTALYTYVSKALGPQYCPDAPKNLLFSQDSHPGNATPQFEMLRFARALLQPEADDSKTLDESLYKILTGCTDKITYRALYSKKIKAFIPRCKPHIVGNTMYKMNGNSKALLIRKLIVELDGKFITERDAEYTQDLEGKSEEEIKILMEQNHWYWADARFEDVIEQTYKAFMWIMIQDYIKNSTGGYDKVPIAKIPKSIMENTADFFVKANIFAQFLKQCIKKEPGAPGVSTYTLYNTYKKWYGDNQSRFGFASYPKFMEEMKILRIPEYNNMYHGVAITYQ